MLWRVVLAAVLFVAGVFGLFHAAEVRGSSLEEARTIAVNALVVMEIFYLFSVRYVRRGSLTWTGVMGTPAVLAGVAAVTVAQLLVTYWPPLQRVFDTRPIGLAEGVAILAAGVALLLFLELEKLVVSRAVRR
jgi:magnesium-transporting ATPase (P-type)